MHPFVSWQRTLHPPECHILSTVAHDSESGVVGLNDTVSEPTSWYQYVTSAYRGTYMESIKRNQPVQN